VKMTVLPLTEEDSKARENAKEERRKRKARAAWERERAKFPAFWDIIEMRNRDNEGDGNEKKDEVDDGTATWGIRM